MAQVDGQKPVISGNIQVGTSCSIRVYMFLYNRAINKSFLGPKRPHFQPSWCSC